MDADLLLPVAACPGILDGWCGPVWMGGWTVALAGTGIVRGIGDAAWGQCMDTGAYRTAPVPDVHLDLSRAECRDRVDRYIIGRISGGDVGGCRPEFTADEDGWAMLWCDLCDPARGGMAVWDRQGYGAGHPGTPNVHALADLDPNDDTRLPDGSRRVDALALRAVAMEAGRG